MNDEKQILILTVSELPEQQTRNREDILDQAPQQGKQFEQMCGVHTDLKSTISFLKS